MLDLGQASRLRPIPLVPAYGPRSRGQGPGPANTPAMLALLIIPHPNRLWWQSRSALDETLARPAPLPSLPCAWESASIMRHDSQTAGLRRSGLTMSLSSQLLDDFVQGRGLGLLGLVHLRLVHRLNGQPRSTSALFPLDFRSSQGGQTKWPPPYIILQKPAHSPNLLTPLFLFSS